MKRSLWFYLATVWLLTAPVRSEEPAGTVLKDYALPAEAGTLHLVVPKDWQDSFKKTLEMGTRVDELKFQLREGNDFAVLVTVFHMADENKVRDFDTKAVLLEAVQKELRNAVEKKPEVLSLKGVELTGSYLSLTDESVSASNPKPGEYKYLTFGYAKAGILVIGFRVVSTRPGGSEKAAALEMIKSAHLSPKKKAAALKMIKPARLTSAR
jgi:hypothetical protein